MVKISKGKHEGLKKLSNEHGIIGALAIDQRGSLQKMMAAYSKKDLDPSSLEKFKLLVSKELTPYVSSILLDPEFGWPAAESREASAGLLVAYEKTGYDATNRGRLPDLLPNWSVKRLKEKGADAVKLLLYYDVDESAEINGQKHAFVERVGSECAAEDVPFFLEIVSYDANNNDVNGADYAKVKPHKVNQAVREFIKPYYAVDVLKVEAPVNMKFVEGFSSGKPVYSQAEAKRYFKEQSDASTLPFIFLSAGVSAELFQETLKFAKEAGSEFNGVLCGRATWKNGVEPFAESGEEKAAAWLRTTGRQNIVNLNKVLRETATPWWSRVSV
ncbi:tagatose-bisphosphate aldolase [Bacillus sonorensis]|uniref:tagatose-bisphosphate aldolase n=1 Tax=Bacillus TaxID=1386 RepID=UPI00049852C6|nr:tagatose-bisphosphate aldolase [Bacillus sonorensis]MBG9914706.1 tagatose-bisphosphate aldolase [Bacillus sonorensis]MCF7616000.1 tagatose-bisphosphate aldolase [Bacillus sonorensis]MCY7858072.1 tagatose-bisphosphate aldolase [Bacillus sonorensis]MCY8023980.1 tagatose-bisphosphate aldolase [Bacillus sonorensis]MCY8033191.1 tagatose-bisphosphate aldolase [Bacillus sonorensis]